MNKETKQQTAGAIQTAKYLQKFMHDINNDKGTPLWVERVADVIDDQIKIPQLIESCEELVHQMQFQLESVGASEACAASMDVESVEAVINQIK